MAKNDPFLDSLSLPIQICESIDECIKYQQKFEESLKTGKALVPEEYKDAIIEEEPAQNESPLPSY